jgi:hypothetical protein
MHYNRPLIHRALLRLDQLVANLNIFLVPIAVSLLVLDTTIFATLFLSEKVLDRHILGISSAGHPAAAPGAGLRGVGESW